MGRKAVKVSSEEANETPTDGEDISGPEAHSYKKSITKAGAARAALAEGIVVPKQASRYIQERFGISISPQQFSAEKSRLKHRSGDDQQFARHGSGAAKAGDTSRGPMGEADLMQALEAMKPLIDQLGVEKVKRMVELLG